ncbi:zinc ribbon domain-containing protein [bacterium]|nr:zinc ribbon domain-containing protein [bacterium]
MICPKCGIENDDSQSICSSCGEVLTPGFIMCPSCGKVLKEGEKYCPRCKKPVFEKIVVNENKIEHMAYTPRYIVKAPFSFPSVLAIMLFMVYSLIFNIVRLNIQYKSEGPFNIFLKFLSMETRPIVLVVLAVLSITTFIKRVVVNRTNSTYEELNKKLVSLKCFILADAVAFFVYFFISFWPSMFDHQETEYASIYVIGGVIGILIFILSIMSLPAFFREAKVRTR